ncbi:hypothetical protein FGW20_04645 [Methanoculleus sp. FWC-SCC3]|uniref:Type I restriction modification DNA specificity domain-containing protein n=1 Tax=Methanoculleus methanifontis TaxID=2584086 RepID=A0ABT8LZY0_9EURY|nr:restriction endonuclease subunit S [Methanoculleus sp. FWC-SCC3]MDN7012339.1 hypothetical protein [Methanoculleus sp. FWC-SCC3]
MPERSEVPEGWEYANLGTVAELISGSGFPLEYQEKTGQKYPFYKVGNLGEVKSGQYLTESKHTISEDTASELRAKIIPKDSIVFAKIGMAIALNRRRLIGVPSCIDNNMMAAVPNTSILSQYLLRFLETIDFMQYSQATTVPSLRRTDLAEIKVPLPPLAEQHRIVAAIEALFARLDAANARLERVPGILKQFRQAVLAAACDGRLTEDWRAENPNRENGSVIISRIVAERKHQSVIGNKNKERIVTPKIIQNGYEEYFEIPSSWLWVNFGTVLGEIKNGISIKPHNDPPGDRILRISALRARNVNLSDYRYLRNSEIHIKSYQLEDNDLLFTRYSGSEEFVGICGLVRGLKDNVILYPDKLIRVRFDHQQILPNYVELFYLNGFARQMIIDSSKSSAGQRGISGKNIRDLPLALPPLPEQHEIVRRVDALFALADRIEAEVAAARAKTETMRQSILARAFSGRLVPTEAELARREGREYEPASVLLERIRSGERAKKAGKESQSTLT